MGTTAIIIGAISGAALIGGGAIGAKKYYDYKQKRSFENFKKECSDLDFNGKKVNINYSVD